MTDDGMGYCLRVNDVVATTCCQCWRNRARVEKGVANINQQVLELTTQNAERDGYRLAVVNSELRMCLFIPDDEASHHHAG
jgi:hypothetical protein